MSTDDLSPGSYLYGELVHGKPWEGEIIPGSLIFTSGSTAAFSVDAVGMPGALIIDDPIPVNETPPFPGWDPNTQVVRFTDENGVIVLAAGYHSLAICDDLELDAEDFNMCSADVVVDPRAGMTVALGTISTAVEELVLKTLKMKEMGDEIERLKAEISRLGLLEKPLSTGAPAPPPAVSPSPWGLVPPYTGKMWEKRPIVREEGWSKDPVFGPEAIGATSPIGDFVFDTFGDLVFDTSRGTAHNDTVDAVSMSLNTMIRKAIGLKPK